MFKPMDPNMSHYDWFHPPEENRTKEDG
jgi:hypothetical protein